MPLLAILAVAAIVFSPAAVAPANAHHSNAAAHSEFAMAKKAKKTAKKPKARKNMKKEEYMRAVPVR